MQPAAISWDSLFVLVTVFVAGFGIAIGVMVPAIGQAIVAGRAMEAIARQPEAGDTINRSLLISLALLESLAIYVLAVVLILLFANPLQSIITSGG